MEHGVIRVVMASAAILASGAAFAQVDVAAAAKWASATVIHWEVVGEYTEKHVQIPPVDADLYADVFERVSISFDWDTREGKMVGTATVVNEPGKTSNIVGMGEECPTGSISGTYEHFNVTAVKPGPDSALLELTGERVHPDTQVAESCGAGLKPYKGATVPATEWISVPEDMAVFAYASMMPADGPIRFSKDGKSLIQTAMNSGWTWIYTPTVKN